jgi:hypothetical protein
MTNNLIPVKSLVANVFYTEECEIPDSFQWKKRGDIQNMTLDNIKTMFNHRPEYMNWLIPSEEAIIELGLQEHYKQLLPQVDKNRKDKNFFGWV